MGRPVEDLQSGAARLIVHAPTPSRQEWRAPLTRAKKYSRDTRRTVPLALWPVAPTMGSMIAMLIGVIAGIAIVAGPLRWLSPTTAAAADAMVTFTAQAFEWILGRIPGGADNPEVITTVSVVLAVCTPGLVALGLAIGTRSVGAARRVVTAVVCMAAAWSFFVLPVGQALWMAAFAIVVTVVVLLPAGFLTKAAMWALVVVLAFDYGQAMWAGTAPAITEGVASLIEVSGLNAPDFWRYALIFVGVMPFVGAVNVALRTLDGKNSDV